MKNPENPNAGNPSNPKNLDFGYFDLTQEQQLEQQGLTPQPTPAAEQAGQQSAAAAAEQPQPSAGASAERSPAPTTEAGQPAATDGPSRGTVGRDAEGDEFVRVSGEHVISNSVTPAMRADLARRHNASAPSRARTEKIELPASDGPTVPVETAAKAAKPVEKPGDDVDKSAKESASKPSAAPSSLELQAKLKAINEQLAADAAAIEARTRSTEADRLSPRQAEALLGNLQKRAERSKEVARQLAQANIDELERAAAAIVAAAASEPKSKPQQPEKIASAPDTAPDPTPEPQPADSPDASPDNPELQARLAAIDKIVAEDTAKIQARTWSGGPDRLAPEQAEALLEKLEGYAAQSREYAREQLAVAAAPTPAPESKPEDTTDSADTKGKEKTEGDAEPDADSADEPTDGQTVGDARYGDRRDNADGRRPRGTRALQTSETHRDRQTRAVKKAEQREESRRRRREAEQTAADEADEVMAQRTAATDGETTGTSNESTGTQGAVPAEAGENTTAPAEATADNTELSEAQIAAAAASLATTYGIVPGDFKRTVDNITRQLRSEGLTQGDLDFEERYDALTKLAIEIDLTQRTGDQIDVDAPEDVLELLRAEHELSESQAQSNAGAETSADDATTTAEDANEAAAATDTTDTTNPSSETGDSSEESEATQPPTNAEKYGFSVDEGFHAAGMRIRRQLRDEGLDEEAFQRTFGPLMTEYKQWLDEQEHARATAASSESRPAAADTTGEPNESADSPTNEEPSEKQPLTNAEKYGFDVNDASATSFRVWDRLATEGFTGDDLDRRLP